VFELSPIFGLLSYLARARRSVIAVACVCTLAPALNAQALTWGLTNLYIFQGGISGPDGGTPTGGLILGHDGNYYGTTWYGGTGQGTLFKVTPGGAESIVHAFSGSQDGALPSKPIQGTDGNFYGTAYWGGGPDGYGIIYKVTSSGDETILQSFSNIDGGPANPGAGLTLGADGNFYGTSTGGGAGGQGTFFRMTPAGALTVLYSFGGAAGATPAAELIQTSDGEFFGTARAGGQSGNGTVFKINREGKIVLLHSFEGGADGAYPTSPLLHGHDGAFYGVTQSGGSGECAPAGLPSGCGTVFRVTAAGEESVVYTFKGYPTDGSSPEGGLVQAKDGLLYGTTDAGGYSDAGNCSSGCGTIFSMTTTGTEQLIYSCGAPPEPWYYECWVPSYTLLLSTDGTLTGTSQNAGNGWGNLFVLAPAPTVILTGTPDAITLHKSAELKWSSTHAQSCEASGAWNGTEALKGHSREVPATTGALTYTLTCSGMGGTASASVTVTVTQKVRD
jgi:uncharacterized repeat protein (TIGR03803 family)